MVNFLTFVISVVFVYVVFGILKFQQTKKFLLSSVQYSDGDCSTTDADYKIVILMPVLREQEVIVNNIQRFTNLNGKYELIYITTEKEVFQKSQRRKILKRDIKNIIHEKSQELFAEKLSGFFPRSEAKKIHCDLEKCDDASRVEYIVKRYDDLPSTMKLIDTYLQNNEHKNVSRIHYPYTNGVIAHQLNYAISKLERTLNAKNTFILLYNADSVVIKDIIGILELQIKKGEKVILQPSLFVENYETFPNSLRGDIMRFVALAQTRWTLLHEIPRVRRQNLGGISGYLESAHVVGHGLCVRLDVLIDVNGYPDEFLNEDLALGYFLSLKNYKIALIHNLENAQSPNTIKDIIIQYTTWFYGASQYFKYRKYAVNSLGANNVKAIIFSTVNTIKAIIWLAAPWIWIILILFSLIYKPIFIIIIVFIFFLHTTFVHWEMVRFINQNKDDLLPKNLPKIKLTKGMLIVAPLAYLVWGIGPTIAIFNIIKQEMFGIQILKHKTER